MELPVIIIHRGYSPYLKWALLQAKQTGREVILIGDEENEFLKNEVAYFPISNFQSKFLSIFSDSYIHMSTNDYKFEYVCFERWFVLLEFLRTQTLELVTHIDSDVMLFDDMTGVLDTFNENTVAAFHIPNQTYNDNRMIAVGHISLWTSHGLQKFCEFIIETYRNNINELKSKWEWHQLQAVRGGICDMTLLYLFYRDNHEEIVNLSTIQKNSQNIPCIFDLNINSGENFYTDQFLMSRSFFFFRTKKILRQHNQFKLVERASRKHIQLAALHCQGKAKILMFHYLRGSKSVSNRFEYLRFALKFIRARSLNYLHFIKQK